MQEADPGVTAGQFRMLAKWLPRGGRSRMEKGVFTIQDARQLSRYDAQLMIDQLKTGNLNPLKANFGGRTTVSPFWPTRRTPQRSWGKTKTPTLRPTLAYGRKG